MRGFGTSIVGSEALQRTLGEAVERYTGFNSILLAETQVLKVSENSLCELLPTCAPDENCPEFFKRLNPELPLTHARTEQLADGRDAWLPAGYVHLSFRSNDEPAVTLSGSTGLAFHTELHTAIWSGLCEVAERDAIMGFWWNQLSLPRLDIDLTAVPQPLAERIIRLQRAGLTAHLFDMSSDFRVPSVFCIVEGLEYPYFVAGASCSADPVFACTKALDEAVAVRFSLVEHPEENQVPTLDRFEWVTSVEHHAALYARWKNCQALDFLVKGAKSLSFDAFANQQWWSKPINMEELRALAGDLGARGLTVLWNNLTLDDAEEFGHCVRVIVPEMIPLSVYHHARWLGCDRIGRFSDKSRSSASDYNPYPHPFA